MRGERTRSQSGRFERPRRPVHAGAVAFCALLACALLSTGCTPMVRARAPHA